MRVCIFCNTPLSAENRAKEHILRNSWLRALGHKKTGISLGSFSKHGLTAERKFVADQLQAGEVCANCNNGWMNYLDHRVEHIILGLARNPGRDIQVSKSDARTIGRWLLKTACCFTHTDAHDRRHIPRSIRSKIRQDGYLPSGFVAFAARSVLQERGVRIGHLDMWPESSCREIGELPQTHRLKFGIQYDCIMLGCCYVNCAAPVFTGVAGFHIPFLESRSRFVLEVPPLGSPDQWIEYPENVANTVLNDFLLTVGVTRKT